MLVLMILREEPAGQRTQTSDHYEKLDRAKTQGAIPIMPKPMVSSIRSCCSSAGICRG